MSCFDHTGKEQFHRVKSSEDIKSSPRKRVLFTSKDLIYLIPENRELERENLWWTRYDLGKFRNEASLDVALLIERHNLDYEMITHSGCMLSLLFIMKSQLDSDAQESAKAIVPAKSKSLSEFSVFEEDYDASEHTISDESQCLAAVPVN